MDEMAAKKRASGGNPPATSGIITKAELVALVEAKRQAEAKEIAREKTHEKRAYSKRSQPGRVDRRVKRYRDNSDRIEEFELGLLKHGISLDEIEKYAKQYDSGTRTPLAKLAHAVLDWWCSASISHMRIIWVDESSGYTERNCPKLSSMEGMDLVSRGLAGGVWVSTRRQLLEARKWKRRMLSLTPLERLTEPLVFGDVRLGNTGE